MLRSEPGECLENPERFTVEFQSAVLHDTNFNNIEKAKAESFSAAKLIRSPGPVWGAVMGLCDKLLSIISAASGAGVAGSEFVKFLEKDNPGSRSVCEEDADD